jgi:hypothetical protein
MSDALGGQRNDGAAAWPIIGFLNPFHAKSTFLPSAVLA